MSVADSRIVPTQRVTGETGGAWRRPRALRERQLFDVAGTAAGFLRPQSFTDAIAAPAWAAVPGVRDEARHISRLRRVDALTAALAACVSYLLWFGSEQQLRVGYLVTSALVPLAWVVLVALARGYEPRYLEAGSEELRRVALAGGVLAASGGLVSYSLQLDLARGYLLTLVVAATGGTLALRGTVRAVLRHERALGRGWMRRVVVAGQRSDVDRVVAELRRSRTNGFHVVGVCLDEPAQAGLYGTMVATGLDHVDELARQTQADTVVVVPCHDLTGTELRRLAWRLEQFGTHLMLAPGLLDVTRRRTTVTEVGALSLLDVHPAELAGGRRVAKDVFDRVMAGVALVLTAPLLLVLMVAIRLESSGPAIFRQERVGRNGTTFPVLKLRTMVVDAEDHLTELVDRNESDGALFKLRHDPRITGLGRILRRLSLDELPQLVNVLRGEMSLVGPRPPLPSEVATYEKDVHRRLVVKPGLTGLWQVSGRSDLPWEEAVRLDLRYVENWSLTSDLAILWKTGRAVLSRSGAY